MWERFSYYGMRALLILYMTAPLAAGGLGFDTAKAAPIYAMYVSSVYLLSLPGGWLADRVLGLRPAVFLGGVVIMAGHICLAVPSLALFYLGLVLIATGTGLLKGNISVLVGKLYAPDDVRRDAGYSLYYMGINTGAFIAPLITGWLAQSEGFRGMLTSMGFSPESSWHWGFGAAAVGMFCGLVQYTLGGKYLAEDGRRPVRPSDPVAAARLDRQIRVGGLVVGAAIVLLVVLPGHRRADASTRKRSRARSSGCSSRSRSGSSPGCSRAGNGRRRSGSGWWSSPCCSWRRRSSGWRTSRRARRSTCSPSAAPTTSCWGTRSRPPGISRCRRSS